MRDRQLLGLTACVIGLMGSALPVVVVGASASVASGASRNVVGAVAAIVIVGSATALVAGALVPWSSEGVGDQLTTFAALAALAIAVSVVTGIIGPRLVSSGLPDAMVVILVCGASLLAALHCTRLPTSGRGRMIADTDTLTFAPGVAFDGDRLSDTVRGTSWPLNGSGTFVLTRMGRPVGQIVTELAKAFSLPLETARRDVLRFVWRLNALALVNVERQQTLARRIADWLQLALRLAPTGSLPAALARRRALDTRSVPRAVSSGLLASSARAAAIAAVATVVAIHVSVFGGTPALVVPLALGSATGLGLGLHEAAHVAALLGIPSALVTRGRTTRVLHAAVSPSRRSIVALAGPLAVATLGVGLILGGQALGTPSLTIIGCPLAAHALALTIVGGDGRVACGV